MNDGIKFTMNQSGFQDLEKNLKRDITKDMQEFFDKLSRRYKGKPVSQVKQALSREWKRELGGSITDPELTNYAEVISGGGKIAVK